MHLVAEARRYRVPRCSFRIQVAVEGGGAGTAEGNGSRWIVIILVTSSSSAV